MSDSSLNATAPRRDIPSLARLRTDLVTLRLLLEHIGERDVLGTIETTRADPPREAHLLTLEDGEHIVLLVLGQTLCHWDASREPDEHLSRLMRQWLAERPSSQEFRSHKRDDDSQIRALTSQHRARSDLRLSAQTHNSREPSRLAQEGGDLFGEDL